MKTNLAQDAEFLRRLAQVYGEERITPFYNEEGKAHETQAANEAAQATVDRLESIAEKVDSMGKAIHYCNSLAQAQIIE